MKALAQASVFFVLCIVAGVVGLLVWAGVEVVQRALDALDMIGPGLFVAGALITFGVFVFVVVGGAVAIVRWLNLRSRMIHPNESTALYPQMYHGPARYLDLNADKSQVVAVLGVALARHSEYHKQSPDDTMPQANRGQTRCEHWRVLVRAVGFECPGACTVRYRFHVLA